MSISHPCNKTGNLSVSHLCLMLAGTGCRHMLPCNGWVSGKISFFIFQLVTFRGLRISPYPVTPATLMYSFTTSISFLCGTFPPAWQLQIQNHLSNMSTIPTHLNLASLNLSLHHSTLAVPLICSFLVLSILVTPSQNLSIFNCTASGSASCPFHSLQTIHHRKSH